MLPIILEALNKAWVEKNWKRFDALFERSPEVKFNGKEWVNGTHER